nr:hypothetical protein [Polycipiviridae sp.]
MSSILNDNITNESETYAEPTTNITQKQILPVGQLVLGETIDQEKHLMLFKELSPKDYSYKEKRIMNYIWTVGTNLSFNYDITPASIKIAMLPFESMAEYWHFHWDFLFKVVTNGMYQGLKVVYFNPAPNRNYYGTLFGRPGGVREYFQYDNFIMSASDNQQIEFDTPKIYPFNYFVSNTGDYMASYPMGSVEVRNITPLATTSPNLSITTIVSLRLKDVKYNGNRIHSQFPVIN